MLLVGMQDLSSQTSRCKLCSVNVSRVIYIYIYHINISKGKEFFSNLFRYCYSNYRYASIRGDSFPEEYINSVQTGNLGQAKSVAIWRGNSSEAQLRNRSYESSMLTDSLRSLVAW